MSRRQVQSPGGFIGEALEGAKPVRKPKPTDDVECVDRKGWPRAVRVRGEVYTASEARRLVARLQRAIDWADDVEYVPVKGGS